MAGASLAAQAQQPVAIGVIGLGLRSSAHLDAFRKLAEAKVAALSDVDSARMAKVNEGLPSKAATYTDYRELIRDKNVGVVVIVTPPYLHHEMTMEALRAGKDVLVEKPMASTYAQAAEIQREARRSGRIVAVGMQRRYSRNDAEYQQVIDSGQIGPIRLITYHEFRGDWNPRTALYTDPATGKTASWRFSKKAAGSSELEFSVHAFAMVTNMVKAPLARLAASGGVVHYTGRDTRDVSTIIADFSSGARLDYSFSCFAPGGGSACIVLGDKGVLRREQGKLIIFGDGKPRAAEIDAGRLPAEDPEVLMYREFFRNVRERRPSPLGPDAAIEASKIAYAAEISISENRIVTAKDFA
mgnify:CR=1 FL=1